MTDVDGERATRLELLDAFHHATRLRMHLERVRPWQAGRRRELERRLTAECVRADRARAELGVDAGAKPLRTILEEAIVR